ncbi:MAG: glycosyltransferase [Patescibacteria group bacterium]
MKVVIIIPTYNEKGNIDKLIPILEEEIFPQIKNHEMNILVADDNSPDGTEDEVRNLMKKWKNLEINSGEKRGLGAAYVRGMGHAIKKMDADIMFELDADFQHDPKKIPEFLKKIDEGADMVVGNRYSNGGSIPQNWPLSRKIFSIVANLFVRTVFMKFSVHDWTGGYRALKKEVFLEEKEKLTNYKGYIFQISFLHMAIRDGFRIGEVPFHFSDRNLGKSKIAPLGYIMEVFKYVISARVNEIIINGKFGKFLVVGGTGFVINWIVLNLLITFFSIPPEIANLCGAVLAIFSNYNINNLWTFGERRATNITSYFLKMLQFYATSSFGVIFIQTGTIFLLGKLIGHDSRFLVNIYFIIGTGLLMMWNFTVYNKVIWRRKKPSR